MTARGQKYKLSRIILRQSQTDQPHPAAVYEMKYYRGILEGHGHLKSDEIPEELRISDHLDVYIAQMNNGGLWQFAENSGWDREVLDDVTSILEEIGTSNHLPLFRSFVRFVEENKDCITGRQMSDSRHSQLMEEFADRNNEFFELNDTINLADLHTRWIMGLRNLEVCPDKVWKFKVMEVLDENPFWKWRIMKHQRGTPWEDRQPQAPSAGFLERLKKTAPLKRTYFEYASELASCHGLKLSRNPAFSWREFKDGIEVQSWVFNCDQKHYFISFKEDVGYLCEVEITTDGHEKWPKVTHYEVLAEFGTIIVEREPV